LLTSLFKQRLQEATGFQVELELRDSYLSVLKVTGTADSASTNIRPSTTSSCTDTAADGKTTVFTGLRFPDISQLVQISIVNRSGIAISPISGSHGTINRAAQPLPLLNVFGVNENDSKSPEIHFKIFEIYQIHKT